MPKRIALLLRLSPLPNATGGLLNISDVSVERELSVSAMSVVLTLERESGVTVARGHLVSPTGSFRHSVQGDAALFDALAAWMQGQENEAESANG